MFLFDALAVQSFKKQAEKHFTEKSKPANHGPVCKYRPPNNGSLGNGVESVQLWVCPICIFNKILFYLFF